MSKPLKLRRSKSLKHRLGTLWAALTRRRCTYDQSIGCRVSRDLCEDCAIDGGYIKTICKGCGEAKELRAGYCRDCLGRTLEHIDVQKEASEYAESLRKR